MCARDCLLLLVTGSLWQLMSIMCGKQSHPNPAQSGLVLERLNQEPISLLGFPSAAMLTDCLNSILSSSSVKKCPISGSSPMVHCFGAEKSGRQWAHKTVGQMSE